jgi:hypothetical protein
MMIFRPVNPLMTDTEYKVTIESSATDIAGNLLKNKYILNFRTIKLPDSDGDKYPDASDMFPDDPTEWLDTDGDSIGNNKDNFPDDPTEWFDTDGDNIGNNKDSDDDNDGLSDVDELKLKTNPLLWDTDGDGHNDLEDKYPLDNKKWKKSDNSGDLSTIITISVLISFIIVIIIILFLRFKKRKKEHSHIELNNELESKQSLISNTDSINDSNEIHKLINKKSIQHILFFKLTRNDQRIMGVL